VRCTRHTDKKEKKIFLIYKEIQMGEVAKSYIYEKELPNTVYEEMDKYLTIYLHEEVVSHSYITLQSIPSEFPNI
jgi:hypothetical protein